MVLFTASSGRIDTSEKGDLMSTRPATLPFDPTTFLSKVGEGKTILRYRTKQVIFAQGDSADAVYYLQKGKVKLAVVSEHGKEAVIAILGISDFFGEGCLTGTPLRWRRRAR